MSDIKYFVCIRCILSIEARRHVHVVSSHWRGGTEEIQDIIGIIQAEFLPRYLLVTNLVCLSPRTAIGRYSNLLYRD